MAKAKAGQDLTIIGARVGSGFVRAHFLFNMKPHALITAPIALGLLPSKKWNGSYERVKGAESWDDGAGNTLAMAGAGSALAKAVQALKVDGEKGWHIPSQLESLAMICCGRQAKVFCEGGLEFIPPCWLWTSTQYGPNADCAWGQNSTGGNQDNWHKVAEYRVLAARRVEII